MNSHSQKSARIIRGLLLISAAMMAASDGFAHVKWFSKEADCKMPPLTLEQTLVSPGFITLGLLSLCVMWGVYILDQGLNQSNSQLYAWFERLDQKIINIVPVILRLSLSLFYMICLCYFGSKPVYLTPELHAISGEISFLHGAMMVTLLWRKTAWFAAVGISLLFAMAVQRYGWFHLLDYPVFLGVAAFLALDSWGQGKYYDLGLKILRASAAITLMWAGAEKWLYPWWSYGMLSNELSHIRGVMDNHFFMNAAGWIEFCAAFALLIGGRVVQLAALFLVVPFVAAIIPFGMIDAIGHAPIIVVLFLLGVTRTRMRASLVVPAAPTQATGDMRLYRSMMRGAQSALKCVMAGLAMLALYRALHVLAHIDPGGQLLKSAGLLGLIVLGFWLAARWSKWRLDTTAA